MIANNKINEIIAMLDNPRKLKEKVEETICPYLGECITKYDYKGFGRSV